MTWVPVGESLPVAGEIVLVNGGIAYISAEGVWYTLTAMGYPGRPIQWPVTHWMQLPEPPTHDGG